jgi:hypothetical protein
MSYESCELIDSVGVKCPQNVKFKSLKVGMLFPVLYKNIYLIYSGYGYDFCTKNYYTTSQALYQRITLKQSAQVMCINALKGISIKT